MDLKTNELQYHYFNLLLFDTSLMFSFSFFFVSVSFRAQAKACRCKGMSNAACCTPRARCVPKMCCGLRCRQRGPTAVYKPSCKYFNYPLMVLKSTQQHLQAWKICLSLEKGRAGLRGIVIFPGHVVTAELWAVIAREVRKKYVGITSHLKIPSKPAESCCSKSVRTAGFS